MTVLTSLRVSSAQMDIINSRRVNLPVVNVILVALQRIGAVLREARVTERALDAPAGKLENGILLSEKLRLPLV